MSAFFGLSGILIMLAVIASFSWQVAAFIVGALFLVIGIGIHDDEKKNQPKL